MRLKASQGPENSKMDLMQTHRDLMKAKEKKKHIADVTLTPQYELLVNMVSIANLLCIIIRQIDISESTRYITFWIYLQMVINFLFLIELASDFRLHGVVKSYFIHFRTWPETASQVLNLIAILRFFQASSRITEYTYIVKVFELIIFIRALKLMTLLYEVRNMRIIIETMRNLVMPLLNLLGVLLIIYYFFALLGMFMFGGRIRKGMPEIVNDPGIPDNYYLDNFNDLLSSLITLFTLMVVNNWMVQVQMYVAVMGSTSYRLFFGCFYYFSVIIGINIVVAFTIDMYSSVERLDQERVKTLQILEDEIKQNVLNHNLHNSRGNLTARNSQRSVSTT
mmetsp:Transcript_13705/g.23372  ORF Transcript_13705/g.23372 Transcript_13705/m.23372 type:complete len:337 (-) Transcript_13705:187-1197(-)